MSDKDWINDIGKGLEAGGLKRGELPNLKLSDKAPRVVAIDPGGVHCGVAWFTGGECIATAELTPWFCMVTTRQALVSGWCRHLVVEEFRLYPNVNQAYSPMETCQVIGVLKWLCATETEDCDWVEQPANIKKPTKAILAARGEVSIAKRMKAGNHAADAELHGHYWINNKGEAS